MKTRLLTIFVVLICTITFTSQAKSQCWGPRYLGKIIAVDQDNNYLKDATVYRFYGKKDSVKQGNRNMRKDKVDYQGIKIYTSWYFNSDEEPADFRYVIHVEGYANLYLKNLDFVYPDWRDTTSVSAVIYITMHAAKFVKTQNQISRVSTFKYEGSIAIKDTIRFNIQESEEYNEATKEHTYHSNINTEYAVKTYPNPVIDEVVVSFKDAPRLPQKMELFSIEGKKIKSFKLSEIDNRINLNWLDNGVFLIILYDQNSNPIHQEKLTKI